MKRLFFAIPLTFDIQEILARAQHQLRRQFRHSRIAWTDPHQTHLTLHFLASVKEHAVTSMIEDMERMSVPQTFCLKLNTVDAFPSKKDPQIIIVRTNIHPFLLVLRQRLADVIVAHGLPIDERPFHPHITLGRVRSRAEVLRPEAIEFEPISFLAEQVILFTSTSTADGYVHTPLYAVPLSHLFT